MHPESIDNGDAETYDATPPGPGAPVDPPQRHNTFFDATIHPGGERRPVVPAALRNSDQRRQLARYTAKAAGHTAAYHGVRLPKYAAKTAWYTPIGLGKTLWRLITWARAEDGNYQLRQQAALRNDPDTWLKLDARRQSQAQWRWWVVGAALVAVVVTVVLLFLLAPWWAPYAALIVAVPVLARLGRPADKPITDRVSVGTPYRRLTAELVRAAMLATGYGKEPADFAFPREITRDGPGYSALVDLPHGVTTDMVMDRRDRAAARLRLPMDQVWMRRGRHAGQVEMWVADEPVSAMRQPAWPLLRAGRADIFKPLPIGFNERGELVSVLLMFTNLVIGAIPRMGKTFVLRLFLLAACLDPRVRVGAADLKGTGDLGALAPVASWYFVGDDEDELDALMNALRSLNAEMRRRTKVIRELPRDLCPESKVTPQLAESKSLGLEPVVFGIDECQVLFTDEDRGKEAERLATDLIKRGPAVGIVLILATQRPDAKSLPTGISANAGLRFCLRVMGQMENDMVLGTSMYKNGIRATQFTAADKGTGWLVGAAEDPMIVRTSYADAPMAERVVQRALQLRGGPVDAAEKERVKAPAFNLLEDVRAVWPVGESAIWSELAVQLLGQLRPDVYGDWDVRTFGAAMKAAGVVTQSVHRKVDGRGVTKYGVILADLHAVLDRKAKRPELED